MLRRKLKDDHLLTDYFNTFLRVAVFPVKLWYNVEGDAFLHSRDTATGSLQWQPLVLNPSQKDVMFQWLEKERYGLFKNSDLYFEYTLCTQLTSSDVMESDEGLCQDNNTSYSNLSTLCVSVENHSLGIKKTSNHSHLMSEAVFPSSKPLADGDDVNGTDRRPSIKLSPSLSKIEEEGSTISSSPSVHSEDVNHFVTLQLPLVITSSPLVTHHCLSPALSRIEEEDERSLNSSVSSSENTSFSPTTVNQGIMEALMDQKNEHASKDCNGNATPSCDANSDLSSVSLDPAIWSDSEGEMIGGLDEPVSGLRDHSTSNKRSKKREKEITPAMRAVGSVQGMSEFKSFLYYTNGAILFHYWMDAEHLKHHLNPHTANTSDALWSISSVFKEFQSKYSGLLCSLGYPSLVTGTPDYTWLTSSQGDVLGKLRSYWLPRFMIAKPARRPITPPSQHLTEQISPYTKKVKSRPVFKPYGKSSGCFDVSAMTTQDSTTEKPPHDPFYAGMITNKNAGNPFQKYLAVAGLQKESCLLEFWEAIEDYTELLEQHLPHLVTMQKAWLLWRTFLMEGSPKWIQLTKTETQLIYAALQSSDVEEITRVLSEQQVKVYAVLKQHWKTFLHRDYESLKDCVTTNDQPFHPVVMDDDRPKPKVKKHVRIKAVAGRRRIRRKPADLDRVVSLDTLARDQRAIASFESYLVSIYGSSSRELHSLQAWRAIGTYRRIPESKESKRNAKGIKIHKTFIYQNAKKAVIIPDLLRDSLQVMREFNTPTADDLVELQKALVPQFENVLQKYIQGSVREIKSVRDPAVLSSSLVHKEVIVSQYSSFPSMDWGESSDQSLKDGSTRGSVFGSVALLWLKKSKRNLSVDGDSAGSLQNALKQCLGPLDKKMASFLDFLHFYGPQKCRPLLYKNLLFWFEAERYKVMFKSDPDQNVLKKKIEAIVDCYLDTASPPWLQVDIPSMLAGQIVDLTRLYLDGRPNPTHSVFVKESELLGNAQDFIFQELLPFWTSFCHKNNHSIRHMSASSKPSVFRSRATSHTSEVSLQLPPITTPMFGQQMLSYSILQGLRWKVSVSTT